LAGKVNCGFPAAAWTRMVLTGRTDTGAAFSVLPQEIRKTANSKPVKNADAMQGLLKPKTLVFTVRYIANSSYPFERCSGVMKADLYAKWYLTWN
jgi:hypothetical protein